MALRPSNTRPLRYPPTSRIRLNHRLAACRHLRAANPMMRLLMDRVGQCTLVPRRGAFAMLCDSIISQQLSIAAATTIFGRLVRLIPEPRPDADGRLGLHGPVPPRGWIVRTESPVCPRLGPSVSGRSRTAPPIFKAIERRNHCSAHVYQGSRTLDRRLFLIFSLNPRRTAGERSRHSPIHQR
jgi:hypothetical protein